MIEVAINKTFVDEVNGRDIYLISIKKGKDIYTIPVTREEYIQLFVRLKEINDNIKPVG